jgi:hypothetical protein
MEPFLLTVLLVGTHDSIKILEVKPVGEGIFF